jgi:tetratricopeptide (TPR) repeat protein
MEAGLRLAGIILFLSITASCPALAQGQFVPATQPVTTLARQRELFFRKSLINAYETVGSRDPKWNADARKVLGLAVRRWIGVRPQSNSDVDWQITFYGDRAARSGCVDPAVLYSDLRSHVSLGTSFPTVVLTRLDQGLPASRCAPFIKVLGFTQLMAFVSQWKPTPNAAAVLERLRQGVYDNLPAMLAVREFPIQETVTVCEDVTDFGRILDGDRKPTIDKVYAIMGQARPDSPVADFFKGSAYWRYSADVPGRGAADVPGSPRNDRHLMAEACFRQALLKDPHCAAVSSDMIGTIVDEDGDPKTLEEYFQRAIADDPDSSLPYYYKAAFLNNGQPDARDNLLAFGRVCLATRQWAGRVPFQLLRVQKLIVLARYYELRANAKTEQERQAASKQALAELYHSDAAAWRDVQDLYVGYLAYNPSAVTERIDYAKVAGLAGDLDTATEQMVQVCANTDPAFHDLIWQAEPRTSIATALTSRGLGMQATGHPKQALADFQGLCQIVTAGNPRQWYFHIWLWMVREQLGDNAKADQELAKFVQAQKPGGPNDWPAKIAAFLLNQMSEADFLAAADMSDATARAGNQCEAWYYAGKKRQIAGDSQTAADYFAKCVAKKETNFVEDRCAQLELKALGQ